MGSWTKLLAHEPEWVSRASKTWSVEEFDILVLLKGMLISLWVNPLLANMYFYPGSLSKSVEELDIRFKNFNWR